VLVLARLVLLAFFVVAVPAVAAPPPGRWESKPAAPAPRQEAAFVELDGKLYLAGGFEYGGADSARHEVYDTATESWSVTTPLPSPSHHLVGAAVGGKIYYLGGMHTLGFVVTGETLEFDPATKLFAPKASLPKARQRAAGAVAVHAGKLIYVGGLRNGSQAVSEVDMYDPAADASTPRDHLGVAVVGNTLYAVGGRQGAFETEVAATEALDLKTMKWRTGLARIPTLRAGFATAAIDGEIVTVGGEGPAGVYDQVEAYDTATNSWRSLAASPLPRHGVQGVGFGGGLWVAGGGTDLLVGATAALDVFYPGARPQPALPPVPPAATLRPPAQAPPSSGSPAAPATPASLSVRVRRVRRGAKRVAVRFRGNAAAVLELHDARRRRLARTSVPAGTRTVTLRVRRGLRRGRFSVTARSGPVVVTRRFAIR
jgi:N-acetylneuraminic acid mutarotase